MNKDVIYIEPEDDITDVILKIENSKEKIVALVPPKKAGVFRSVVNIKLIAKAGLSSEKTVVLVTVDPSIVKLAAATKLPVAKNLQSAPVVPKLDTENDDDETDDDELDDELEENDDTDSSDDKSDRESDISKNKSKNKSKDDDDDDESDDDEEAEEEKPKKAKKTEKAKKHKLSDWIKLHKKLSIFGGICVLGLVGFLVWAFVFAPAVDITVAIKTEQKNFSENVSFTNKLEEENAEEGKFYLEQKKIDETQKIEFEATGKKNRGNKATGEITISRAFFTGGSMSINQGTVFSINGLNFVATENVPFGWGGWGSDTRPGAIKETVKNCSNASTAIDDEYCLVVKTVKVEAAEGGTAYNIPAKESGWSSVVNVEIASFSPMTGGTDDEITVVQQSDVIAAENQIKSSKEEENKNKLFETIDDKYYVIDSSFEQSTSNTIVTPNVDEEVKAGTRPSIEVTTTATVYVIDKVKLEEFIEHKVNLADDQKIYDIKDIYVENVNNIFAGSATKLKAQYFIGPKITESEVVDKIKGRGLGDARREISDIYGVSDVNIQQSYPWVMAIPSDSNKVTVKFEVKDQDGNEIEDNSDEGEDNPPEESNDQNND